MIRRLKFFSFFSVAVAGAVLAVANAHAEEEKSEAGAALDVAGLWLTDDGEGRIEIADCGDGSPCGVLVWISPDAEGDGTDAYNPDPALAGRPLIGAELIWGFERKKTRWKNGRIYDPKDGKTYRSILELQGDGNLKVKGCVGPFCRSLIWTRVEAAKELEEQS